MAPSVDQLLSKAKTLARKGDANTAAQIYRSILQRFPKNKRANTGLRSLQQHQNTQPPQNQINALIALLQQGQLQKVVQHATPMARQFPNNPALHDFLGMAHMGLLNYDQSIENFRKVLQTQPDYAEAHNNLGAALRAKGHLGAAIQSYQNAIRIKPNYPEAHNNLGIAQQEQGAFDAAIASYKNALLHAPNYADAYFNLGSALKETGALNDAITNFKKGLSINPDNAEALNHLGNALQENGQSDNAMENYQKALQVDPDFVRAHMNIGSALKAKGQLDDALTHFKTALQIEPDHAESYRNYASAVKFKAEDKYTLKIAELLKDKRLPEIDQMHLNFALAKVRLDIGQAANGIQLLKTANALRKKELNYDISIDETLFGNIKKVFAAKISTAPYITKPKQTPIFILGMSRSGTTLVEQIISSHSDVYGAGELNFIGQIIEHINPDTGGLQDITADKIRTEYFNKISKLNTDRPFITDKMPANFRWAGFLAQAFPEAKIIHTNRNPAAVCWSNFKLYFPANGMKHTFDMEDIARYYGLYQDLMNFWHKQFPNRIYDLNYEKLTENQLEETQKLLSHLELNWQDSVMNFHKNTRSVATASNQQVRSKMYKGSSQEWEKYQEYLKPMLDILNTLPS